MTKKERKRKKRGRAKSQPPATSAEIEGKTSAPTSSVTPPLVSLTPSDIGRVAVPGGEANIYHGSGLVFVPAIGGGNALAGKRCWGQLLNDPQFRDLAGLETAISMLDHVGLTPAWHGSVDDSLSGEVTDTRKQADGWRFVVSDKSGQPYAAVSEKYVPVQDADIVVPFVDVVRERGVQPIGRVDGVGTGRTKGHVVLANPDFKIQLLKGYDEDVMLGVRFWNSYDAGMSFGAEMFGVRTVCINYNLWGSLLGQFQARHTKELGTLAQDYAKLLDGAIDNAPVLQNMAHNAVETVVLAQQIPDLLWGVGLGARAVDRVATGFASWAPEVARLGLNAWTVYNAVTAYISWRDLGGQYLEGTQSMARDANELLTAKLDEILDRGQKRRTSYEDAVKAREKAKQEARQVA